MFRISISIHTDAPLADEVRQLLVRVFVPILQKFPAAREIELLEILTQPDPSAVSFAAQFLTDDLAAAEEFLEGDPARFLDILSRRHPERILHFTSKMKIINGEAI